MNKERRKELESIKTELESTGSQIDTIKERLQAVIDAETESFDNLPDSFRDGERGEKAQAAIDSLQSAFDEIESFDVANINTTLDEAAQ